MPAGFFLAGDGFAPFRQGLQRIGSQLQQGLGSGFGVCQPAIEGALHFPGGLAERGQPHHAPAAFEGMEGAAQIGELRGVGHVVVQSLNGAQGVADDFCRFFQEDVAQVFFFDRGVDDAVVGQRWCGGCGRECRNGLRQCLGVFGLGGLDAVKRLAGLLRQRGLTGQFGLLDHIAELFGGRGGGQGAGGLRADQIVQRGDMCLPQLGAGGASGWRSVACRRGGIIGWRVGRHCYVAVRQLLRFFVEIELCLGQCGLVDHHVEHEGQGTQAVA